MADAIRLQAMDRGLRSIDCDENVADHIHFSPTAKVLPDGSVSCSYFTVMPVHSARRETLCDTLPKNAPSMSPWPRLTECDLGHFSQVLGTVIFDRPPKKN